MWNRTEPVWLLFWKHKTAKRVFILLLCVWQSVLKHKRLKTKTVEIWKMKTTSTCFRKQVWVTLTKTSGNNKDAFQYKCTVTKQCMRSLVRFLETKDEVSFISYSLLVLLHRLKLFSNIIRFSTTLLLRHVDLGKLLEI
jgi:hypothetical protein